MQQSIFASKASRMYVLEVAHSSDWRSAFSWCWYARWLHCSLRAQVSNMVRKLASSYVSCPSISKFTPLARGWELKKIANYSSSARFRRISWPTDRSNCTIWIASYILDSKELRSRSFRSFCNRARHFEGTCFCLFLQIRLFLLAHAAIPGNPTPEVCEPKNCMATIV